MVGTYKIKKQSKTKQKSLRAKASTGQTSDNINIKINNNKNKLEPIERGYDFTLIGNDKSCWYKMRNKLAI
jgi:hypothetical protein